MDQLPITLLSLINTVVEQYKEFSWSSQEQNQKMKITLTWTNETLTQHKSKSRKERDRKLYEQFISQKQNNAKSGKLPVESNIASSEEEDTTDNDMDIVQNLNTPSDASLQVNITPDTNGSIKKTIEFTTEVDSQPCKQVNNGHLNNKQSDSKVINRPNTQERGDKAKRIKRPCPRRFFQKVVMKTTSGHANTLIGQLPGKDYLVVHSIDEEQTEIVNRNSPEWRTYKKNCEDFNDVNDTEFMDGNVKRAIRLMEMYIGEHLVRKK